MFNCLLAIDRVCKVVAISTLIFLFELDIDTTLLITLSATLLGASLLSLGNEIRFYKQISQGLVEVEQLWLLRLFFTPITVTYIFYITVSEVDFFTIVISITLYSLEAFEIKAKKNTDIVVLVKKLVLFVVFALFFIFSRSIELILLAHPLSNLVYLQLSDRSRSNITVATIKFVIFQMLSLRLMIVATISLTIGKIELLLAMYFRNEELILLSLINRWVEGFAFFISFILFAYHETVFKILRNERLRFLVFLLFVCIMCVLVLLFFDNVVLILSWTYFWVLLSGSILSYYWAEIDRTDIPLYTSIIWLAFYLLCINNFMNFGLELMKFLFIVPVFASLIFVFGTRIK